MDFELSDDQVALQEAARDLLDGLASPEQVRAHMASGRPYDEKLWSAMLEQGWLDLASLGLGWVEAAVLLEEIGRHVAPVPFLPTLLASSVLGPSALGPALDSGAVGCAAWGPAVSWADGGLHGRTHPAVAASCADVAAVWTPDGVFAVDLRAVGRPEPEPAMDQTRPLAWLVFDGTPAELVGAGDDLLERAAVGLAAEMLGAAARVLEMSTEYAKDRVQFGQPIGSFQAVKHRCADMLVDVEGMRSATWWAAWALAAGDAEAPVAASTAKIWCSDAARRVMASGLQVHGGIGFTWEHDLHLYLKRSQLDQVSFGDAAWHRERLAGLLRGRIASGQPVI